MLSGTLSRRRTDHVGWRGDAGLPHWIIKSGYGRVPDPRPFHRLTIFENVALAGYYGQGRHSRADAEAAAERAGYGRPADRSSCQRRWPGAAGPEGSPGAGDRAQFRSPTKAWAVSIDIDDQAADMLRKIRDDSASPSSGSSTSWC
jgi:branched-chain amino acid transport system ATP-binding protein